MVNSEVGHTNIGAGRVVAMDLGQIDLAIEDRSFFSNAAVAAFIATMKASGGTAHLMGVVSDGGVHGHIEHVLAACRSIAGAGVPVALHAVTDGRAGCRRAHSSLRFRAATTRWTATTAGNGWNAPTTQ
jgi:2,3-bisphosphoglycerate-independent phosphoglycerate mutase